MGDIIVEIADRFGLGVKGMESRMEGNLVLTADGRKYIIMECRLAPARMMFIHGTREHLAGNGFGLTDRFLCTKEGEPFFMFKGKTFTMSVAYDGRECDFLELDDVKTAAENLARLHIASAGYEAPVQSDGNSRLGKMPELYKKRMRELSKLKNYALRGKGEFDHIFLENVEFYGNLGNEAATRLEKGSYSSLADKTSKAKSFCHHDYCHRNVICGKQGVFVKGFDYCCREIRVKDVVDMLRRHLKNCSWSLENTKQILDSYCSVSPLEKDELEVLKVMLSFPYKFWSVSNKFYNSKRCWAEKTFVPKISEIVEDKNCYVSFLEGLEQL